jgi:hypothetical protein
MSEALAMALLWGAGFALGWGLGRWTQSRRRRARVLVDQDARVVAWRGDIDLQTVASWEAFQEALKADDDDRSKA